MMSPTTAMGAEKRGHADAKGDLLNRLARVKGQVGGIERMVEQDRYCIDIVTQISAAQVAFALEYRTRHCVLAAEEDKRSERTEELAVVARLLGRTPRRKG